MRKLLVALMITCSFVSVGVSADSGKKLSDDYMAMIGPGTRKTYRVSGKCLVGEIQDKDRGGRVGCISCDPGYYYRGTSCQPCGGNTYTEKSGTPKSCRTCPKGKKANKNHTQCVKA